jgi:hypothetical protein
VTIVRSPFHRANPINFYHFLQLSLQSLKTLSLVYRTSNFLQCHSSISFFVKSCQNFQNTYFFFYMKKKIQRLRHEFLQFFFSSKKGGILVILTPIL